MQTAGIVLGALTFMVGRAMALPGSPAVARGFVADAAPTVTIKETCTVVGRAQDMTENFNGIPYAQPPTGQLRLRPPARLDSCFGTIDASSEQATACPQIRGNFNLSAVRNAAGQPLFPNSSAEICVPDGEDCLTLNVVRPKGAKAGDLLPVLFWIFGGGFEAGCSSLFNGTKLVSNAMLNGKPYLFVAVNYRVGGFGFLAGAEVLADGAANLGLLDQRMGLEWVADNIAAFGGDPSKVTIFGESAGSISVVDQMVLYGGDNEYGGAPLFRAAIMSSGSIIPADPVNCPKAQAVFDQVAREAGCDSCVDKLACLRAAPYARFLKAANSVASFYGYTSLAAPYLPRPDFVALPASPNELVANGRYAAVPMIIGDQEDEGTLFSLAQSNVTTTDTLVTYLNDVFYNDATREQIAALVDTYSPDPAAGSPFGTGSQNEIYPGYKRLAAVLGDVVLTLMRRAFLSLALARNPTVPAWSYLSSYDFGFPVLGTFHGSDLPQIFYGVLPNYPSPTIQNYFANFVWNLDPNDATGGSGNGNGSSAVALAWPRWTASKRQLVQLFIDKGALLLDDFREASYNWIANHLNALRL